MDKSNIKPLDGWFTISEVAEILGRQRNRVHQMVSEGKFEIDELCYVSPEKKIILISSAGVIRYKQVQTDRINRIAKSKKEVVIESK